MSKRITILILGVIFLIAVGVTGIYIARKQEGEETKKEFPMETPSEEPVIPIGVIDCGTDLNCLIEASKDCKKAKAIKTTTIEIFGMLITTITFLEIKGVQENECLLYLRTEKQDLRFSEKMIQTMLKGGATQEQIEQQEKEANKYADMVEGKDGTCKFKTGNDLSSLLGKWKEGTFSGGVSCEFIKDKLDCTSTGDWAIAKCEGEMFSQ